MTGEVISLVGEHTIVVLLNGHLVNGLRMCMFIPVFLTFLVAMIIHPGKSNIGRRVSFGSAFQDPVHDGKEETEQHQGAN